MNRSLYLTRRLDHIDRSIIAALYDDGRRTIKDVAELLDMASPSIAARIDKLKDAGAIRGYTVVVDPKVFGLNLTAFVRMNARPGEMDRVAQLLEDAAEVVEAHHITGENCFLANVVVSDAQALQAVVARFEPYASADTAILISTPVSKRLPKLQ
jgi:Lrp/AsnC family transcriptional regulator, leucine-responsive regulatory protein